jgi:fimbrial isopeptide formation D2 family protein/LPXTG-motif cell wall-anchored protein
MKNRKFGLGRRIAAVAAATALGVFGVAGAAHADDSPVTGVGNIDASHQGSIIIHKRAGSEGEAGNGNVLTPAPGTGLDGVTFKIQKVDAVNGTTLDVTDPAAWDTISNLSPGQAASGTLGASTEVTTANGGDATASNLALGVYLVTETNAPSNVASQVAPFVVTLPLPQGNGKWLYDVNVYPKNQLLNKPTKTVSDPDALKLGSNVTWTIDSKVPALNSGDTYKSFVVTDQLDSRLGFVSATLGDPFTSADYTVTENNGLVTITLKDSGLARLVAGNTVTAKIKTTVDSLGDNGIIDNTALVNVNNSKQESNTPKTMWGDLEITKVAAGDDTKTLEGAEFAVYASEADATAGANPVGTLTTGSNGKGHISLYVGKNDEPTTKAYWIKETKAPAGYVLSSAVKQVGVKAGALSSSTYTIENTQQNHPNLPLTGANGKLLATIVGAAIVLLAAGSALVVSRRRRQA